MDATTSSGKARTVALASGGRPTATTGTAVWFEAQTSAGLLRLGATGAAQHAAAAAITLQQFEPLLDALDAWTAFALDWRWLASAPAGAARAAHACAHWNAGADGASCGLELPWALLRILPTPPSALTRQLRWQELPVELVIAHLGLGSDEVALLEPGGAVVLPESMRPTWHGLLRAAGDPALPGLGVPVVLTGPSQARRIPARAGGGDARAAAPAEGGWRMYEVRIETSRPLPADRLASWFEGDLSEVGPRAALWRCAGRRSAAKPLASGRLMPWGDGSALAVEALIDHAQTSDPSSSKT